MPPKNSKVRQQVGALPYRLVDGVCEVMLVQTRGTGRWIMPKGWPMDGRTHAEAAQIEAYEEAGVRGTTHPVPLGTFASKKVGKNGKAVPTEITLYALRIDEILDDWPERDERARRLLTQETASQVTGEAGLADLLRDLRPGWAEWTDAEILLNHAHYPHCVTGRAFS